MNTIISMIWWSSKIVFVLNTIKKNHFHDIKERINQNLLINSFKNHKILNTNKTIDTLDFVLVQNLEIFSTKIK